MRLRGVHCVTYHVVPIVVKAVFVACYAYAAGRGFIEQRVVQHRTLALVGHEETAQSVHACTEVG